MGSPRRQINKFSGPRHPWERERLEEEKGLLKDYGLKNKKDIWKETSYINRVKEQVKKINTGTGVGIQLEKDALLNKLERYNLLKEGQTLDDALELTARDIMERRLQTQVVRQGFARSMRQARQFIVHGHIAVNGKKITSPSYMVNKEEQFSIGFVEHSELADPEHPERKPPEEVPKEQPKEEGSEEKSAPEAVEEDVSKEIEEKLSEDDSGDAESSEESKKAEDKEEKKDGQ